MPFPTKIYTDVVLYVPAGCKSAYSTAPGWKYFWNVEEKEFPSGVEGSIINTDFKVSVNNGIITVNSCEDNVVIYDMQGRMVYNGSDNVISGLPSGIYVIKAGVNITKISI